MSNNKDIPSLKETRIVDAILYRLILKTSECMDVLLVGLEACTAAYKPMNYAYVTFLA